MIIAFLVALFFGLTSPESGQNAASGVSRQERYREITDLLNQLAPRLTDHRENVWVGVPWDERVQRVRTQLILIANESPELRKSVINALISVLNDPKDQFNLAGAERWRVSVALLGELNATEAIDDLVRNINWTSYSFLPHPPSPVRTALVRIGKPAVPRLLTALSEPSQFFPFEASETLVEIGVPSVDGLIGVLGRGEPSARRAAAHTLARIGGARAREGIEVALRVETDEETKKNLESAIGLMDHVECLKDSSKCK